MFDGLKERVSPVGVIVVLSALCVGIIIGVAGTTKSAPVSKRIEFNQAVTEDSTYVTFEVSSKKLLVITGVVGTQVVELK